MFLHARAGVDGFFFERDEVMRVKFCLAAEQLVSKVPLLTTSLRAPLSSQCFREELF